MTFLIVMVFVIYLLGLTCTSIYLAVDFDKIFTGDSLSFEPSFEAKLVLSIGAAIGWPLVVGWWMIVGVKDLTVYGLSRRRVAK